MVQLDIESDKGYLGYALRGFYFIIESFHPKDYYLHFIFFTTWLFYINTVPRTDSHGLYTSKQCSIWTITVPGLQLHVLYRSAFHRYTGYQHIGSNIRYWRCVLYVLSQNANQFTCLWLSTNQIVGNTNWNLCRTSGHSTKPWVIGNLA